MNLLRSVQSVNGEPRFAMLETIRDYARERLAASGEENAYHRRHLRALPRRRGGSR